jgi:tetratricopeptide (TPR) repeat protein
MRRLCFAVCLMVFFCFPTFADEGQHHEELTPEQLGTVHFPVSCAPAVQKPFERGIALLHSFWYEEAEKEFEKIAKDDPSCAMAHWGVAMSLWHELWDFPSAETTKRGQAEVKQAKALQAKSDRERDYIAAMSDFYSDKRDKDARVEAYSKSMEHVYSTYADDREGAAFYALSLLANEPDNDTTFAGRKKAAAVLEKLFAEEPDHPGVAHYLIHSYDKPQLAELGLPAARRYAQIAPAAPHALHMPSHIFARLGLWHDDIQSNLASIAATRKTAAMHMGGEGHQFHAMDFLLYAYMQSGHEAEGLKMVEEIKAMPPMKDMYDHRTDMRIYALTVSEARYALELHHWKEAAELQPVAGAGMSDKSVTYWARAIGAARSGNVAQARTDVQQIDAIHSSLAKENKKRAMESVETDREEAQAWLDHASGKDDAALAGLRKVAEKEEATGERTDVGIPAREMLADLLLEIKRPDQALAEYEAELKFYPNRFNGLYGAGKAAEAAGKTESAGRYYAQLMKVCDGSGSERPELAFAKKALESDRSGGAQ